MFDGSDLGLTLSSKISPKAGTLIFLLRSPSATAVVLFISFEAINMNREAELTPQQQIALE